MLYAKISKKATCCNEYEGKELPVLDWDWTYFILDTSRYGEPFIEVHISDLTSIPYSKSKIKAIWKKLKKMIFKSK